jgi:hypothetical protein
MIRYFCDVCGQEISHTYHPERLPISTEQIPTNRNMVPAISIHNDIIVCAECRSILIPSLDSEIDRMGLEIRERKRTPAND